MSEHIKKLAEQAGMEWDTHIWCWLANPPHLEKFAELVRQDEREACAKLCDAESNPNKASTVPVSAYGAGGYITAEFLAERIRSRK